MAVKYFGCNDDLALMWPTIGMLLNKILELHPSQQNIRITSLTLYHLLLQA